MRLTLAFALGVALAVGALQSVIAAHAEPEIVGQRPIAASEHLLSDVLAKCANGQPVGFDGALMTCKLHRRGG